MSRGPAEQATDVMVHCQQGFCVEIWPEIFTRMVATSWRFPPQLSSSGSDSPCGRRSFESNWWEVAQSSLKSLEVAPVFTQEVNSFSVYLKGDFKHHISYGKKLWSHVQSYLLCKFSVATVYWKEGWVHQGQNCGVLETVLGRESGDAVSKHDLSLTPCTGLGVGMNLYLTFPWKQRPCFVHTATTFAIVFWVLTVY